MNWASILIGLLFTISLSAQEDIIRNYRIDSGLNSNTVYDLLIDRHGYLWAATEKGANRFDGKNFKSFTTTEGVPDNDVLKIFEDSKGRIWFLPYNGKLSYYLNGEIFTEANWPLIGKAEATTFFSAAEEFDSGEIIFYTRGDGLLVLNDNVFYHHFHNKVGVRKAFKQGDKFKAFILKESDSQISEFDPTVPGSASLDTLMENQEFDFISDQDQQEIVFLRVTKDRSLYFFLINKENYSYKVNPLNISTPLKINFVKLTSQEIILGTYNGLFFWDRSDWTLKQQLFKDKQISSYLKDFEGNTWVSTLNEGLFQIRSTNLKRYKGISEVINTVEYDQENKTLWAGGIDQVWKVKNNIVEKNTLVDENLDVLEILPLTANKTIFSLNGIFLLQDGDQLIRRSANIKSMIHLKESNEVFICFGNAFKKIKINDLVKPNSFRLKSGRAIGLTKMARIQDDQYYLSSNNGLYFMENYQLEGIEKINTRISSFHKDSLGNFWMASHLNGLYHVKETEIKNYTISDGLIGNELIDMAPDNRGNLWVTADQGIGYININEEPITFHNYPLSSELYRHQITGITIVKDSVFIGSSGGLYYFLASNYNKEEIRPKLNIEGLKINGITYPLSEEIKVRHNQNRLHVAFSGISYTSDDINFRYRFSASDSWNYTDNTNIDLVNLNPGEYRLTIQAIKLNTVYSESQELSFTILKPFYKRAEFLFLFAVLTILIFYGITQLVIKNIKSKAENNRILAESQQKALRAQMNPHFLFNALNSIQHFFLAGKNINGQEYISKFSRLIRNTLDNSDVKVVTIESEIQNLKMYTDLENLRMKNKFEFLVIIDPSIDPYNQFIPSMLLQPIVENSIWHGINYLKGKTGKITLAFQQNTDTALSISIRDNGIGLAAAQAINSRKNHKSKGRVILQERIKAMNATRQRVISFSIEELAVGGTLVTIKIPHDN